MKSEVDLSSTEENMPQLANLNTSLNNLTRAQVGVLHCLITTFTLVSYYPPPHQRYLCSELYEGYKMVILVHYPTP